MKGLQKIIGLTQKGDRGN